MVSNCYQRFFPPNILQNYADFTFVCETPCYLMFNAKLISTHQKYTIRILNTESNLFRKNPNQATGLFIQEIINLCLHTENSDSVIADQFEISEAKMAFVTKVCYPLRGEEGLPIEKMLNDIEADLGFLEQRIEIPSLDISNIFRIEDSNSFFISAWSEKSADSSNNLKTDLRSQLGLIALEAVGVNHETAKNLLSEAEQKGPKSTKEAVAYALKTQLPNKESEESPSDLSKKEQNCNCDRAQSVADTYGSPGIKGLPELKLAWCSAISNAISTYAIAQNKSCETFQGAKLKNRQGKFPFHLSADFHVFFHDR